MQENVSNAKPGKKNPKRMSARFSKVFKLEALRP